MHNQRDLYISLFLNVWHIWVRQMCHTMYTERDLYVKCIKKRLMYKSLCVCLTHLSWTNVSYYVYKKRPIYEVYTKRDLYVMCHTRMCDTMYTKRDLYVYQPFLCCSRCVGGWLMYKKRPIYKCVRYEYRKRAKYAIYTNIVSLMYTKRHDQCYDEWHVVHKKRPIYRCVRYVHKKRPIYTIYTKRELYIRTVFATHLHTWSSIHTDESCIYRIYASDVYILYISLCQPPTYTSGAASIRTSRVYIEYMQVMYIFYTSVFATHLHT